MQNWYDHRHLARIAQIWKYVPDKEPGDTDVDEMDSVREFYEMEFKLYALKNRPFKGMPQRKANIIAHIEQSLSECCHVLLDILIPVYTKWLSEHALLDPTLWAEQRAKFMEETCDGEINEDTLQGIIDENLRYTTYRDVLYYSHAGINFRQEWYKMMAQIEQHVDNFPSIKRAIFNNDYISDQQNMWYEDLASQGHEAFGRMVGQTFADEDAAQRYIDNLDISQINITMDMEMDTFCKIINGCGMGMECVKELYQYFVFPNWAEYWKARGMEEIRAGIEKVYKLMQTATQEDNINNMCSAVSAGLNGYHVNGSMMEYCDSIDKKELDALTNGLHVPKCIKELKAIGVDVTGIKA